MTFDPRFDADEKVMTVIHLAGARKSRSSFQKMMSSEFVINLDLRAQLYDRKNKSMLTKDRNDRVSSIPQLSYKSGFSYVKKKSSQLIVRSSISSLSKQRET